MKKTKTIIYIISYLTICGLYLFSLISHNFSLTTYEHLCFLGGIGFITVPIVFEIIFKRKLSCELVLIYMIFVFLSHVYGTTYHGYGKIYFLDDITHFYSAVMICFFVYELFKTTIDKNSVIENFLFIVGCTCLIGVLWEIIEFCGDEWFNTNNQAFKIGDVDMVGHEALKDTMMDLIIDFVGGLIGSTIVVIRGRKDEKRI